jgi:hypothetical protein
MATDFTMGYTPLTSKLYVIPQDPEEREFILSVDRKTKADIYERYGLHMDQDFMCNTVTYAVLETLIKSLAMNSQIEGLSSSFNFYDLIIAKISNKVNEMAEKEGNINISFFAGPRAVGLITGETEEDNTPRSMAEEFSFEEHHIGELYASLDRYARYLLIQQYGITMSDNLVFGSFAIAYTFLENLFKYLLYNYTNNNEDGIVSINYVDLIEFHVIEKDDGIMFALRPGYKSKIPVKDDENTEADNSEE